jgi:hypothetical protein
MKKFQEGFSAIEALLIVIIVGMLGGVGYYVYHSQQQVDKIYTQTSNNGTVHNTNKTSTPSLETKNSNAGYFVIKEWGVRAKYSGTLTLQYSPDANDSSVLNFNSSQLKAADPTHCTDGIDGGGVIVRYAPTDPVEAEGGGSLGTAQQYFTASNDRAAGNYYSKVGDYYYQYQHPQSACSDKDSADTLQTQTDDAVNAIVQNLQAVPAQ